jgi:alanyl aminopeptidase
MHVLGTEPLSSRRRTLLCQGLFAALLLSLAACSPSPALSTPPIFAPAPAAATDAEAAPGHRLPADTRPLHYGLMLEIVPERATFRGQVRIQIALDRPRESIFLHAKNLTASSVRLLREGSDALPGKLESLSPSGLAAVRLPTPVGPGKVELEISYEAPFDPHLAGLYRTKVGDTFYAFTQFEAIDARKAFPCFDEPRFKTPFDVVLRVPEGQTAIANTRELSAQPVAGGLREVRFALTERLPTYLIAFAVGPLDVVNGPEIAASALRNRPVPLRGVAVKGRGADLALALRETPKIVEALERYFGIAYAYDKLDLIAVPDFGAGAMENAGAITFRDSILLVPDSAPESQKRYFTYVNAHELAHQWFGNLVTMAWWDDLWLNESFASWMEATIVDELYPEYEATLTDLGGRHHAMDVDSQASTGPIHQSVNSDEAIEGALGPITYSKGAAMLAMFERYLGRETFREGLRLYMKRHAFGNATASDLTRALGEAAKKEGVSEAFFSFLDQPGVPLVRTDLDCAGEEKALTLSQSRALPLGSTADATLAWHIPVCAKVGYESETREVCALVKDKQLRVPLAGPACPSWVMPNAAAAGYYRFALTREGLAQLVQARDKLSPEEQMSLAANVWASARAGTVDADRALAAIMELLSSKRRVVLESALKPLSYVNDQLLDDTTRPYYRAELGRVLKPTFDGVGLLPKGNASADGEQKLLRALLVRVLAFQARDPAVLEELTKLGEASLGLRNDARLQSLPSELVELALFAAVQERGAPAIERALERLWESQDGLTRSRLLGAISAQKDPALTPKVMALALDDRLRSNERLVPIRMQHGVRETREAAYGWLKQNFDALAAKLGEHGTRGLINAPGELCSDEAAADIAQTFAARAKAVPGGESYLALTVEGVRLCAALRASQAEKARDYFKARAAASAPKGGKPPKRSPPPAVR